MAQAWNVPDQEQIDPDQPSTPPNVPERELISPAEAAAVVLAAAKEAKPASPGSEAKVADVVVKAAEAAVAATAAPEVAARKEFEAEGPQFDPVPTAPASPVARPEIQAIPVASPPPSAPATRTEPPTAEEYDRMVTRRAASGSGVSAPHPSTLPPALRPTPQGPR